MTVLTEWAERWGVSPAAIADLRDVLTVQPDTMPDPTGTSEAAVQAAVRLEASEAGCRLWRNNVGACKDEAGRMIRYGLCNESAKMNHLIKSSDLIGVRPVVVRPEHVGTTIGQFMAREVKQAGWTYKGTPREVAQLKFLQLVTSLGGDARFAAGKGSV
jgi:hypothetical protein